MAKVSSVTVILFLSLVLLLCQQSLVSSLPPLLFPPIPTPHYRHYPQYGTREAPPLTATVVSGRTMNMFISDAPQQPHHQLENPQISAADSEDFGQFVDGDGHGGEGFVYNPPPWRHSFTVIFLHGFGDTADITALPRRLLRRGGIFDRMKYILPLAPERQLTPRRVARGWADLTTTSDPNMPEDEQNIRHSANRIRALIEAEIASGTPPSHISIGGFSQGGAVAYVAALEFPNRLGALFALSCWCPLLDIEIRRQSSWPVRPFRLSSAAVWTPVLHCHGTRDPLVLPQWGQLSVDHLRHYGVYVEEHLFDAEHHVVDAELVELAHFLERHLRCSGEGSCTSAEMRERRRKFGLSAPAQLNV